MFYSQFILAKKGPLGTIWIAAHLERKLRKNQVADTDIGVSVDSILFPDVPIALRLSSHLLLGVVKIYSRKVNYLFDDCSEALLKVKQAFRSTVVDLPPDQSKAPYHSITMPETFDLDDFELPDNEILQGNYVDHHVSSREQITLQDTMDGVAFRTSQFGPDERFGDGDASQIGLDLNEDLLLDNREAAGTNEFLMDTDADPQASVKAASPSNDDENNEGISDHSLASPANYFSIQGPSTPGLMEEPNLPSAQEVLVSDDHMDEDHNPSEMAAKEVSGTAPSLSEPSNLGNIEFHANGKCHHLDEQENEKGRSIGAEFSIERMQLVSSCDAQLPIFTKHVDTTNYEDTARDILCDISIEKETNITGNFQLKGDCDVDDVGVNEDAMPMAENASIMELHGCDLCPGGDRTDLHGNCPPLPNSELENKKSSVHSGVGSIVQSNRVSVSGCSEPQNVDQPCLNSKVPQTFESHVDERSSAPSMPLLQACNSHVDNDCGGVDNFVGTLNLPAEDVGLCSWGISEREAATDFSGISMEVRDATGLTLNTDQITHEVTYADNPNLGFQLYYVVSGENHLDKENNSKFSDLAAPEKLLSMPCMPAAGPEGLVEFTPSKKVLAEGGGDDTGEKIISGRKRSYTESTLTIQSVNSAESSGASHSRRSVEFIVNDDDLLSSILVGKRSTALKMKPTPPVVDTLPAKRQRVAQRSSAQKRKVLVDDSMVLHGEMIRQQLTNTEDIRRVRKKAPCTRLEIWMLQKQFLEDEIFSAPVFTGMSSDLRSLYCEAYDLSRTRIVRDDGGKLTTEMDTSTSKRPSLGEETKSLGTPPASVDRGHGNQDHGESLVEISRYQDSTLGGDVGTLQRAGDIEVTKEISEYDVSGEKVDMANDARRVLVGDEGNHYIALQAEHASSAGALSEVNCNLKDDPRVDLLSVRKTDDSGDIDASCQLADQKCYKPSTTEDNSMLEDAFGAGIGDQEGVATMFEKLDSDGRLDGKHILEKMEDGVTAVVVTDIQDNCFLPLHDVSVIDSVLLEGGACPTADQTEDEHQSVELEVESKEQISASEIRQEESNLTSNHLFGEDLKLDSSYVVEADSSSQNIMLPERENLDCQEANPKTLMNSTMVPADYIDGGIADFGPDAIEHDTDFLNVDDDEVAEDYEDDMPNTEENRILDNSGWSTRTRAVANYLQVLFGKEDQHGKDISLDSLLAGKSRKEASRMFFETLVLKTKDYIHAEQKSPFYDIQLNPRGKIMKAEF